MAPEPDVVAIFPGDMLQFISKGVIMATPHQVHLADKPRYSFAYFHEPSLGSVLSESSTGKKVHYGEHFTNMFKRCYPDKPVTKRILRQHLEGNLPKSITTEFTF